MTRLLVHVEGYTEEEFVNGILAKHLQIQSNLDVSARIIGNARQKNRRGGICVWSTVKKEIIKHLRNDRNAIATTMVDYYAMPISWPGRREAGSIDIKFRAETVETAIKNDLVSSEDGFNLDRFVPYVVLHEFEGLLFSDCTAFADGVCRPDLSRAFKEIRDPFPSPEEINDSPNKAPSKRIKDLMPDYNKVLYGNLAAIEVGLEAMRTSCPNFERWISSLEKI